MEAEVSINSFTQRVNAIERESLRLGAFALRWFDCVFQGSIAELGAVLVDKRLGLPQRLGRSDVEERGIHRAYFEQNPPRD